MKAKTKAIEIGEGRQLSAEKRDYLLHIRGNPALEAELAKALQQEGWKQAQIAKEMKVTQMQISRLLQLFQLTPRLFERLKEGTLKPSVAYVLCAFSKEEQKKFEGKEKITLKDVLKVKREATIPKELIEHLDDSAAEAKGSFRPKKGEVWNDEPGFVDGLRHLLRIASDGLIAKEGFEENRGIELYSVPELRKMVKEVDEGHRDYWAALYHAAIDLHLIFETVHEWMQNMEKDKEARAPIVHAWIMKTWPKLKDQCIAELPFSQAFFSG